MSCAMYSAGHGKDEEHHFVSYRIAGTYVFSESRCYTPYENSRYADQPNEDASTRSSARVSHPWVHTCLHRNCAARAAVRARGEIRRALRNRSHEGNFTPLQSKTAWGARGPEFKSRRSDQSNQRFAIQWLAIVRNAGATQGANHSRVDPSDTSNTAYRSERCGAASRRRPRLFAPARDTTATQARRSSRPAALQG
jgi:hypothetical protein